MSIIKRAKPKVEKPHNSLPPARMALLFLVMLTTAAGNTAMQSVMPSIGTALGVDDVWVSIAYTWSAALWVVCAPFWARRSDRRGRKAMMALGLAGFTLSMGLCGFALYLGLSGALGALWTLVLFAAFRSLYGGFGSAAPPAVQAYVASRTSRKERTQALSLIASSFGLGTVIGPALAPFMVFSSAPEGLIGPYIAFALIGLAAIVTLRLYLPNDTPHYAARGEAFDAPYGGASAGASANEEENADAALAPSKRLGWWEHRLRPWVIMGLVGGHAHAMILGIVGFAVLDRLHLRDNVAQGTGPVGIVLMCGAAATLLAQWGIIPRFKLGPRAACLVGVGVGGLGTGMLAYADDLHSIILSYGVLSLGFGLFRPGFNAGASLAVGRHEQGEASGVVASVTGAAFVFAPAIGVWLYGHSGHLGFGLTGALCACVFVYGWFALDKGVDEDAST